jgi:hypothetical protein
MTQKGQITLESLLLYGVAILVVLLAVGALTYFGILDLGRILPDRCEASSSVLDCEEWSIVQLTDDGDGTLQFGIRNLADKELNITNAEYQPDGASAKCSYDSDESTDDYVRGGEIIKVVLDCPDDTIYQNVGQKTRGNLILTHDFKDGAISSTTVVSVVATIGG